MMKRSFFRIGHFPTLLSALLYFDVSFMAWVIFGPLAPFLRQQFHLTATEQGLLVAIPLLGGSLFRPLLGALADRIGGRRAGFVGLSLTIGALLAGWTSVTATWQLFVLGFCLGVAGASFAVALPLASRWYPSEYQGLAMGIVGAGNSGSLMATLFAPRLAERIGWANTVGCALIPIVAVAILFALCARDSPVTTPKSGWKAYAEVLRESDTLWFSFLYSLTFGGFVGFTSFLTTFFHEQYQLSRVSAGDFTTVVVVSGSLLRPVGGWLSDRIGGYRLLVSLLVILTASLGVIAMLPPLAVVVPVLFATVGCLGMGNGAVFQLVPQRFTSRMGIVTGIVGAAGGLGGFFLPSILGAARDATGTYATGLSLFAVVFGAGALMLFELGERWSATWPESAVKQSGIFSYRKTVRLVFGGAVLSGPRSRG
jgi:MFS transporter, NNP family, nitrate/nitrite transporter